MRSLIFSLLIWLTAFIGAGAALANCAVIDGVDRLHAVQTRLARDPNTTFFASDIRFMRNQLATLADRQVLQAVNGNVLTPKGAAFSRFMRNSRAVLEGTSVDDPASVLRHFNNASVRRNLQAVGGYLGELRCTAEQIAVDSASALVSSDDDAAQILREAMDEVLDLTNILMVTTTIAFVIAFSQGLKVWVIRLKRRAKRYPSNYPTLYKANDLTRHGVLIDVSGNGTKLEHDPSAPLAPRTSIEIMIFDEWMRGTVIWSNSFYSGVTFKRVLHGDVVQQVCVFDPEAPPEAA